MKNSHVISASIVLYNENIEELKNTIQCFLSSPLSKKLFLIDNSLNGKFFDVFNQPEIHYILNENNIGFGAGHNKILEAINGYSDFHLILNPDVTFKKHVIENLIFQLEKNEDVSMIAPKALFPNGEHQYSCRRYPTVSEMFARRFNFLGIIFKRKTLKGKYFDKDLNTPFYAEYLTGCFHLYKTQDFICINGFDERYFLYMEDVDICKKIDVLGKRKLYYPHEEITHILKQESSKSIKLFFIHLFSAIKYFLKWGFKS